MTEYSFKQLLDIDQVRQLLVSHHTLSGMAYSLFDTEGNNLISVGWQDVCVRVHRANPATCLRCHEGDTYIKTHLYSLEGDFLEYRCQNGMINIAMPTIIDGTHMATFFTGQFFYEGDWPPDTEFFSKQTEESGFAHNEYLSALESVPIFTREHIRGNVLFLHNMIQVIAEMGRNNLNLAQKRKVPEQQESEARSPTAFLSSVINPTTDPIFVQDSDHRLILVNPAECDLAGTLREELVGKTEYDIFPRKQVDVFWKSDKQGLANGETNENEELIPEADGRVRKIVSHKSRYGDPQGKRFVVGNIRDLTNCKRAGQRLTLLEYALDHSREAVYLIDEHARFFYVNDEACRSLGYSREQLLNMGVADIDPNISEQKWVKIWSTFRDKGVLTIETLHQPAIGSTFPVEVTGSYFEYDGVGYNLAFARDISARKQMEDALRESENKFRTLAENSPDNILRYDRDCRITYFNPQVERLLEGLAATPIIGNTPLEHAGEEFRDYQEKIAWVAATGENAEIDVFLPDMGEGVRHHNVRFVAERNTAGMVIGVLAIGRDITERKQMEDSLKESEQKFRTLAENIPDLIVRYDSSLRRIFVNPAWEKASGLSANEVVSVPAGDIPRVPSPVVQDYAEKIRRVLATGVPEESEFTWVNACGENLFLRYNIVPEYDQNGNIISVLAAGHNLTERKHFEMQLLQREQQYRKLSEEFQTLLDGIPDMIVHLSPQMTIIWGNKATTEHLGGEGKDSNCYILFHGRSAPCDHCPVCRAFASGQLEEEVIIDKKGRHWGIKAFPLRNGRGQVASVIKYITDITEKIHLREEAARSAHLAALGQLAAGVAHEINNPNGVVLLNMNFLTKAFADIIPILDTHSKTDRKFSLSGVEYAELREDLPHLFTEARDGARRIKRIVDELKEFVRPVEKEEELFDLNTAVQTAIKLIDKEIKESTNCLQTCYGESLPRIKGNQQAVEQVIVNLLSNACQALTGQNQGIFVSTSYDIKQKMVIVEVRDQGMGIPPEKLPYITAPFFTTRGKNGGTGLGLALSSRMIKEHGGEIQFASTPGIETTVTVSLPTERES